MVALSLRPHERHGLVNRQSSIGSDRKLMKVAAFGDDLDVARMTAGRRAPGFRRVAGRERRVKDSSLKWRSINVWSSSSRATTWITSLSSSRLDDAVHRHQPRAHHDLALPVEDVGPDDEVGDPGLVLDGDEHHALGAARPLADQHQPGDRQPFAVADGVELLGGDELLPRIMFAQEAHRVRFQAEADGLVIVHDMLAERHRRELRRLGFRALVARLGIGEQRQVGRLA